jgi:aspartyl aminopeptidase
MSDADEFRELIARCPTRYHFVSFACELLLANGYAQLPDDVKWTDVPAKFFVVRDSRSFIAFNVRDTSRGLFLLSPNSSGCLATKPKPDIANPSLSQFGVYSRGHLHAASWFDRDLKIAGRALLSDDGPPYFKLFESPSPICVIPHVSSVLAVDPDNDLRPIMTATAQIDIVSAVAGAIGCPADKVIDFEGLLIDAAPPVLIGGDLELLNGQSVDVRTSAICSLRAFLAADDPRVGFAALGCFDCKQFAFSAFDRAGSGSNFRPLRSRARASAARGLRTR